MFHLSLISDYLVSELVGFFGDGTKLKIHSEIFLPLYRGKKLVAIKKVVDQQFLLIDALSHEHWPVCCKCSTKSYNYLINTPDKIIYQAAFRYCIILHAYHTRAIITRGLYVYYPLFQVHFLVYKEIFLKNSVLMYVYLCLAFKSRF